MAALETGAIARGALSASMTRITVGEGLAASSRIAVGESIISATATRSAVGRIMVGSESSGLATRLAFNESQIGVLVNRRGLSGVFAEIVGSNVRTTINPLGSVMIEGRPLLRASGDGSIRLWTSGRLVGQIRGQRIYGIDSFGAATVEIGELETGLVQVADEVSLQILPVRPDWYRLVLGRREPIAPTVALATVVVASEDDRREEKRNVSKAAIDPNLEAVLIARELLSKMK